MTRSSANKAFETSRSGGRSLINIRNKVYRKRVLFGQEPLESFLKVNLFFVLGSLGTNTKH